MSLRTSSAALVALSALLAACTPPMLGPPPPGRGPAGPSPAARFNAADFAWSQKPGRNGVAGKLTYRQGPTRFTCAGSGVVLTPDTPWSRRRMAALYGSTERAALPADDVRARTPSAPPGDAGPFVKRTTCDAADRFSFSGLPDGVWYVIGLARPAGKANGESLALMRRVTTRGGRVTTADL
jgi:hypothetical protein